MKLKIKVKVLEGGYMPQIIDKGEWIDLRAAENVVLAPCQSGTLIKKKIDGVEKGFRNVSMPVNYVRLGVAMKLPDGFEAILVSRSSTPYKFNIFVPNSFGVIDNSYCGNEDEWKLICTPLKKATINRGDRICQFRIQLSQKATFWQKLKWFFSSGVELVEVDKLEDNNRGGIGSTGIK